MKNFLSCCSILLIGASAAIGAETGQNFRPTVQALEQGPSHTKFLTQLTTTNLDGTTRVTSSSFVEIGSFLNYKDENGAWQKSHARIEAAGNEAVLRTGPLKATWPGNLIDAQGIEFKTDETTLVVFVSGLAYTEETTGRSVLLASTVESFAQLNQNGKEIIYPNAFSDGIDASVRYFVEDSGTIHQDIIIHSQIPSPLEWDLDPAFTKLEIWTEFLEAPVPNKTASVVRSVTNYVENTIISVLDEEVQFGKLKLPNGKAFRVGNENSQPRRVYKTFEKVEGNRNFLIEQMDYAEIEEDLSTLEPELQALKTLKTQKVYAARIFPKLPSQNAKKKAIEVAMILPPVKGFVADYILSLDDSSLSNYVFKSGVTYLVKQLVNCIGTTVIEPNAIFKFTNSSTTAHLRIRGPLEAKGRPYAPITFTSYEDNTVGSPIVPGSTNVPAGYYGTHGLFIDSTNSFEVSHLRMRNVSKGLQAPFCESLIVRNCQFGNVLDAIHTPLLHAYNVLVHNADTVFSMPSSSNYLQNVTLSDSTKLRFGGSVKVWATNSIFAAIPSEVDSSSAFNITNASPAALFTNAGAGSFYLSSTNYRNSGTTNVDSQLLAELRDKTTYPPAFLTNAWITTNLTISPYASRDQDDIDCGYHYEPLDYLISNVGVSNATIEIQSGTAIGVFGGAGLLTSAGNYGFFIDNSATLKLSGEPLNTVKVTRYNLVQEQSVSTLNSLSISPHIITGTNSATDGASLEIDFAELSMPDNATYQVLWSEVTNGFASIRHSQFTAGTVKGVISPLTLTNCLLEGVYLDQSLSNSNYPSAVFVNSTFHYGEINLSGNPSGSAVIRDNIFNQTSNSVSGSLVIDHDWNVYVTNFSRFSPEQSSDIILSSAPEFELGGLGSYYLPSGFAGNDAGSEGADDAGLYHFTTSTSNDKEENTRLDIGFHYASLDSGGVPWDSDGDGMPDWFEDINGNGIWDSGETDWEAANESFEPTLKINLYSPLQ